MKKILGSVLAVILVILAFAVITSKDLLAFAGYVSTIKDVDFKAEYSIKQLDEEHSSIPSFLQSGTLTGEIRGARTDEYGVHGYLYIDDSDVPIIEYYENELDAKYNIGQLCVFMTEKIGTTTGLSLGWISDAVGDFYVAKSQLEQITGNEIEEILPSDEEGVLDVFGDAINISRYNEQVESVFGDRIEEMKFYHRSEEGTMFLIGIPKKFGDGSTIYIQLIEEHTVIEMMVTCTKVENGEVIQMPEGQLTEGEVETIQWIYEKFTQLQQKIN